MDSFDEILNQANEQVNKQAKEVEVEPKKGVDLADDGLINEDPPVEKKPKEKAKEVDKLEKPTVDDEEDFLIGEEDDGEADDEAIISISKEIGVDFKTKKQLKQFIEDSKKYKEKAESKFASEELQKLDEYVRDGGNLKEYLKLENKVGELEAIKAEVMSMSNQNAYEIYVRRKLAEDGIFDEEDIEEQVQNMLLIDEDKIERAGKKYKADAIAQLDSEILSESNKKTDELSNVKEKTAKFQSVISDGINTLKSVDGVLVKAEQRTQMLDIAKNPKGIIKDFFPINEKGEPVSEKWAQSLFILTNHKNNVKLALEKGKSIASKQLFNGLSNVEDPSGRTTQVNVSRSSEHDDIEKMIQNM